MKLHELKTGDEFAFVHLELPGGLESKFPSRVIGKRFRLDKLDSTRAYVTGLVPEIVHYTAEVCYQDYEVQLMALLAAAVPQTSFIIPEDLGKIELLRDHPTILKRMVELSKNKSLTPFIKNISAGNATGGMDWDTTPEGAEFWQTVLGRENPEHFYTRYPRTTTASIMSSKPSYKNGTEQKVPRPAPAIRTGERIGGSAVSGKRSRSAIVCGYLSHRTVVGY